MHQLAIDDKDEKYAPPTSQCGLQNKLKIKVYFILHKYV